MSVPNQRLVGWVVRWEENIEPSGDYDHRFEAREPFHVGAIGADAYTEFRPFQDKSQAEALLRTMETARRRVPLIDPRVEWVEEEQPVCVCLTGTPTC